MYHLYFCMWSKHWKRSCTVILVINMGFMEFCHRISILCSYIPLWMESTSKTSMSVYNLVETYWIYTLQSIYTQTHTHTNTHTEPKFLCHTCTPTLQSDTPTSWSPYLARSWAINTALQSLKSLHNVMIDLLSFYQFSPQVTPKHQRQSKMDGVRVITKLWLLHFCYIGTYNS